MSSVIDNEEVSIQQKSTIVYDCASNVMKDIFDDPRSGENLARTRSLTKNILNFTLHDSASIANLLKLGSTDYYTFTHCVNVAVFAIGLSQMINRLLEHQVLELAMGAILHDVGKTKVDQSILLKPGKLTSQEFDKIKEHPRLGYDLMNKFVAPNSLDIILHHHEKCDGKGYPFGQKGDEISDNSKIVALSDVYDALTTNRCYSKARKPFDALLLMKNDMVGHFADDEFKRFIIFLGGKK